jgi:hypothetical protein
MSSSALEAAFLRGDKHWSLGFGYSLVLGYWLFATSRWLDTAFNRICTVDPFQSSTTMRQKMNNNHRLHSMRILLSATLAAALLCGCITTTPERSGDFGLFLQRELTARGARIPASTPPPAMPAVWTFSSDEYGFVAHVRGDKFADLDKWFRSAFGQPKVSVQRNADGQPQRVYIVEAVGVPLQYGREHGGVAVVCVEKLSKLPPNTPQTKHLQ